MQREVNNGYKLPYSYQVVIGLSATVREAFERYRSILGIEEGTDGSNRDIVESYAKDLSLVAECLFLTGLKEFGRIYNEKSAQMYRKHVKLDKFVDLPRQEDHGQIVADEWQELWLDAPYRVPSEPDNQYKAEVAKYLTSILGSESEDPLMDRIKELLKVRHEELTPSSKTHSTVR